MSPAPQQQSERRSLSGTRLTFTSSPAWPPGPSSGPSVVAGAWVGVASVYEPENSLKQKVFVPMITELVPASGTKIYAIGIAAENALAGNTFSYYLKPTQISGKGFALGT